MESAWSINAEVLLSYKRILDALRYKYPTHIKWYYDSWAWWRPFIKIDKTLYNDPDISYISHIIDINPIILSALFSHLQGLWFFPWYIHDLEDIPQESLIVITSQFERIINNSSVWISIDIIIWEFNNFLSKFASIPSVNLLKNQIDIIRQLPYGIMGCNSYYDRKFYSYNSLGEYLDVLYTNFSELDKIFHPQRWSLFISNIDAFIPRDYMQRNYNMRAPLWSDVVTIGSVVVDNKEYPLNLYILTTYLPFWLSFGIWLQLLDKEWQIHNDTKVYIVNVIFEPWFNGKTVAVINTIQQACTHIYYHTVNNNIELYYCTWPLATNDEISVNNNSYIKSLLHKATMDSFIDSKGKNLLLKLIEDKVHKEVLKWTIDVKSANQPDFIQKAIQKEYNEYMRRTYDPTILLTAVVAYILSYEYDVYIISPEENLRSLYHIEDFNLWKTRSEKTYTYRAELLWWVKQNDGRFFMPFDKVSAFLSDRNNWLGLYDITKIMDWRNRIFTWTKLDMNIIQKNYPTRYDHDTIESIATMKESTIKLINGFSQ